MDPAEVDVMAVRHLSFVRGVTSLALFGLFGLGALLLTPFMLVLRRPERCQPLVRGAWRLTAWLFVATRLIRLERGNLRQAGGAVIAANHPSLIDVVLLTVLFPRTLYVAKRGLLSNPFLAAIVRATALPDDAQLLESAAKYLAAGWNVLIFPEGTRSPSADGLRSLRRGAAQLALRTGSPLFAVRIGVSRRILGKDQRPWDVGDRCVTYAFRQEELPCRRAPGENLHAASVRVTGALSEVLKPITDFS